MIKQTFRFNVTNSSEYFAHKRQSGYEQITMTQDNIYHIKTTFLRSTSKIMINSENRLTCVLSLTRFQ